MENTLKSNRDPERFHGVIVGQRTNSSSSTVDEDGEDDTESSYLLVDSTNESYRRRSERTISMDEDGRPGSIPWMRMERTTRRISWYPWLSAGCSMATWRRWGSHDGA
jgi:hypothetical protein